jgi:hypothetical protein
VVGTATEIERQVVAGRRQNAARAARGLCGVGAPVARFLHDRPVIASEVKQSVFVRGKKTNDPLRLDCFVAALHAMTITNERKTL